MLLQEEYLKRHGIQIPVVNHTLRDGCLLVKNNKPDRHSPNRYIIEVRWVDEGNHPGNYHITHWKHVHDAAGRREHFQRTTDPQLVPYDEYEIYLANWMMKEKLRSKSPNSYEAAVVYMWDMFLCCFDSWFAKSANVKTLLKVEAALDDGSKPEGRIVAVQEALVAITHDNQQVFDRWEQNFLPYAKKNFHWLARMLNGD
jgi:hypothetical protein